MKSIHLFILLFQAAGMLLSCNQEQLFIEAESAMVDCFNIVDDSTASGNQFLKMEDSGYVLWKVRVPEEGYYGINIRYRAPEGSKEQYLLKNDDTIAIGFARSENWNEFSQPFFLKRGSNMLGITPSWGYMDLDWVRIEKALPQTDIVPKKQTIIQSEPNNLTYKIDNYHQSVKQVFLNEKPIPFSIRDYPYQESSVWLKIGSQNLKNIQPGNYSVNIELQNKTISSTLNVIAKSDQQGLVIVAPDVEHGSSVLLRSPNGRYMLIDTGKEWVRDSIIIPLLEKNGIDTLHTLVLTHYHGDHDSGDRGESIKSQFHVQQFFDYKSFPTGYQWTQDSIEFKVLNSFEDGNDENKQSLSLKISYKGFVYNHSGDTYAYNQQKILNRFPDDVASDVFYANHHFHGSVLPEYILRTNPDLVIVQAQEAIYARSAYMVDYKNKSEAVLNKERSMPVETLFGLETGLTIIKVSNGNTWYYRAVYDQHNYLIPELNP